MSTLEYHVLLAMATGPIHGYAIKQAVETESAGTLVPRAGYLYRVIARLIARGLVREASGKNAPPHPGLARRYYALTAAGRSALASEAERLKSAAALAAKRLGAV
jgi:DNA-binding PadR family transcriptional regulator